MKTKLYFFSFIYMGFLFFNSVFAQGHDVYSPLVQSITKPFSQELAQKHEIFLDCSGGEMKNHVKKITLSYVGQRKIDVDEARLLYMSCLTDIIDRVNSTKKLRPYLENYPFTQNSMDLRISFEDENGHFQQNGLVTYMFLSRGKIIYSTFDPIVHKSKGNGLVTAHEETFEEALAIYNRSKGKSA